MVLILWWGGEHTVIALAGRDNPHQFSWGLPVCRYALPYYCVRAGKYRSDNRPDTMPNSCRVLYRIVAVILSVILSDDTGETDRETRPRGTLTVRAVFDFEK
jgi:hypothetical protein